MAATRSTHIHLAIPLLAVICLLAIPTKAQYGGGTGDPNDPFLIYTPEQMNAIGADPNDWDKHFKLMTDIDLTPYAETGFSVIGHAAARTRSRRGFAGTFDGNGCTISNLKGPATPEGAIGLFHCVDGPSAEIKNLTLIDPEMVLGENSYVAPLVIHLDRGTLTNCHVRGGRISGTNHVAAMVAFNGGWIVNCSTAATVEGNQHVGGLTGYNHGRITGCHASGIVTGQEWVGGLVGFNEGSIADSHAAGDVNGVENAGGLVGYNRSGNVENCSATGNVNGKRSVGGLVGFNWVDITESYATGAISGEIGVGGLVGEGVSGTVDTCHAIGNVTGDTGVGGLVGGGGYQVLNSHATGSVTGKRSVGGLIGGISGFIENCYATGPVQGIEDVGGLVGGITGRLVNCFASGDVTGDNCIGGLAGSSDGSITNCYATGSIHGPVEVSDVPQVVEDPCLPAIMRIIPGRGPGPVLPDTYAGGLVGENYGSILNSYSSGAVLRTRGAGGLVGVNRTNYVTSGRTVGSFWDMEASGQTISAGGIGKTAALMRTATTFLGWGALDSQGAWTIDDGNDYPRLSWEGRPGTLIERAYATGKGTAEAPYQVYTADELVLVGWFPSEWSQHFVLMADIDLSTYERKILMIGNRKNPFTGIFDGDGHSILHMNHTSADPEFAGLFGLVSDPNAEIRNLELIDPNVVAEETRYVGSLVGHLREGVVTGCSATGGVVLGRYSVGGMVGLSGTFNLSHEPRAFITACRSTSEVKGYGGVGGLVGSNDCGYIAECCATGAVTGQYSAGGLVGTSGYGTITDCYATGPVTGKEQIGGLTASHRGSIVRCYSAGAVVGERDVGGLVGEKSLYSSPSTTASFWDVDASGQATSVAGVGLDTAAMKTASTFLDAGWDFIGETANGVEDLWWILDGTDHPRLFWELP